MFQKLFFNVQKEGNHNRPVAPEKPIITNNGEGNSRGVTWKGLYVDSSELVAHTTWRIKTCKQYQLKVTDTAKSLLLILSS